MASEKASDEEKASTEVKIEECWQRAMENPLERLSASYNLSKLTDLTITFPGHHEKLQVHRLLLAISSPVFEIMLFGPLAEGGELKLPADPPEAFKWLMEYIYCGSTNLPDVSTAVQVYNLANKYQMDALCRICSKYLLGTLDSSNVPLVYETATLLEDEELLGECQKVMMHSAEYLLSSPDIGLLGRDCLKHLLQQPLCVTSEVSVFKGLVQWGKMQAKNTSSKTAVQRNVRTKIQEFLPYVRFLAMTLDEFVEHVMPTNILTLKEINSILMNIKKVANNPLPKICSEDVRRRFMFDWQKIHTLNFSVGIYYSGPENPNISETARQQLVSDLKVTKNIHLGRIKINLHRSIQCNTWLVEVTDSAGTVLGTVKQSQPQHDTSTETEHLREIEATFSTPLFLSSNNIYSVWLHCMSSFTAASNKSADYKSLNISCSCHCLGNITLQFWSVDDSF